MTPNSHDVILKKAVFYVTVRGMHSTDGSVPTSATCEQFPHIHEFHVRGTRKVRHSEREVWPQVIREQVREFMVDNFRETALGIPDFGNSTCAALAQWILQKFQLEECEVTEDGAAGAIVIRE